MVPTLNSERQKLSYDLFLTSDLGDEMRKQVCDFLAARPNYESSGDDVMYDNSETGVHFQWSFLPPGSDEIAVEEPPVQPSQIGFLSLNFCRPTAFANEAATELMALSDELPVQFFDPQQQLVYEKFSAADQLTLPYREHAQKAVSALLNSDAVLSKPESLPKHVLDAAWKWNFNRDEFTFDLDEDLFVPKIDFFQFDGELKTGVVWGDGVPMICPQVDIVVAYRNETAPSAGWFRRKRPKVDVLLFEETREVYAEWFSQDSRAPQAVSCSPVDASALTRAVTSSPVRRDVSPQGKEGNHSLEMVPFASILDAEICMPTTTAST